MSTTPGDAPFPLLERIETHLLESGSTLWHTHPYAFNPDKKGYDYPATAFNPDCSYRFVPRLAGAKAQCGTWFGSNTPDGALWETVLRNVLPGPLDTVEILPSWIQNRRLSAVRTTQSLHLVEILPASLRRLTSDRATWAAWNKLPTEIEYEPTQLAAAVLCQQAKEQGVRVDGMMWYSRQAGSRTHHPFVVVLFEPPANPSVFEIFEGEPPINLDDTAAGWKVIDEALSMAKIRRRRTLQDDSVLGND